MQCRIHALAKTEERCAGCAEPFCQTCLVEVVGRKYCGACKVTAVKAPPSLIGEGEASCEAATKALTYSIIGIFFGLAFGPLAIFKAIEARKQLAEDYRFYGLAKANVALLLGIAVSALWVIALVLFCTRKNASP